MSDTYSDLPEDAFLAAEYALHLLSADQRAAFEARLVNDPALAAHLRNWDGRFAGMADEFTPIVAPARVKRALDARLFGAPPRRRWPVFGALAGVAAMLVIVWLTMVSPMTGLYQAELAGESDLRVAVVVTADGLQITRAAGQAGPGRSLELWLITPDAPAPISLGLLPDRAQEHMALVIPLPDMVQGAILAISDEPLGGSPTGAPTGDVLATGPLQKI